MHSQVSKYCNYGLKNAIANPEIYVYFNGALIWWYAPFEGIQTP